MPGMILWRRHTPQCSHKAKGREYLKCACPLWVDLMREGERIRESLKTRNLDIASRRIATLEANGRTRPDQKLEQAIERFVEQHRDWKPETVRKYRRVLNLLVDFCGAHGVDVVRRVTIDHLDLFATQRGKANWTWIKEIEILRQFFGFCLEREWCERNPAKAMVRPRQPTDNEVVPYTQEELDRILNAAEFIGNGDYERYRAVAMTLLFRHTGMRVSDVVTLAREHVNGKKMVKQAVKNGRMIQMELPPVVLTALNVVPLPKGAATSCTNYFWTGNGSVRSAVKSAERTMWAVFKLAGVEDAYPHKFRHSLASELLGKGESVEVVAGVLADDPSIIKKHYWRWTPEYQKRIDSALKKVPGRGTNLAQTKIKDVTC